MDEFDMMEDVMMGSLGTEEIIGAMGDDDDFGGIGADVAIGDLLDDNDDMIMGAAAAKKKARLKQAARKMAMLREIDPNAITVRSRRLDRRRRFPLGFERKVIAANGTDTVVANPQNLFRPERVVIPSNLAFDFFVSDLKVGQTSQLVSSGQIPGAIFSEVAIDTNIHFKTAEIGQAIPAQLYRAVAEVLAYVYKLKGKVMP